MAAVDGWRGPAAAKFDWATRRPLPDCSQPASLEYVVVLESNFRITAEACQNSRVDLHHGGRLRDCPRE
jgi:hypothetical protein